MEAIREYNENMLVTNICQVTITGILCNFEKMLHEKLLTFLQEEYKTAVTSGVWHKPIQFESGETVVMHNPNVMVHYQPSSQPDEWGTVQVCNCNQRQIPLREKKCSMLQNTILAYIVFSSFFLACIFVWRNLLTEILLIVLLDSYTCYVRVFRYKQGQNVFLHRGCFDILVKDVRISK